MYIVTTEKKFYKVIVLKIGIMESSIVDERHFPSKEKAKEFAMLVEKSNYIAVVVEL